MCSCIFIKSQFIQYWLPLKEMNHLNRGGDMITSPESGLKADGAAVTINNVSEQIISFLQIEAATLWHFFTAAHNYLDHTKQPFHLCSCFISKMPLHKMLLQGNSNLPGTV